MRFTFCGLLRVATQRSSLGSAGRCAVHCKKDMLEWQCVSRWPFAAISIVTQKKKWKHCQCVEQRWKIILHHLTKLHAFMGTLQIRYESLRDVAMHFKTLNFVERCILNVWGCTNIHIRIWNIIFILLFSSRHTRFLSAYFWIRRKEHTL